MPSRDDLPLAFDLADALTVGYSRHQFQRIAAGSDVVVVAPRTHAEAVRWFLASSVDRHQALSRVAARRFTGSALSHTTAALWHGLPNPRHVPDAVCLTVDKATPAGDDQAWVDLQRSRLPGRFVTRVRGVPVTTLDRTAIDCLRTLPKADGLAIADRVVRVGVPPADLVTVRRLQSRWPGVRRARWGIGLVDGRRETWLESASVAVLDGWGLPTPTPQVDVFDRATGGFIGRVDLLWRALRVVGEADGRGKYRGDFDGDTSERAVADRLIAADIRADRLREVGLGVVRWGTPDLRTPLALVQRVRLAEPHGPLRAEMSCAACRNALDDCSCAPRLFLPAAA
jgi:hypothetical protein